MQESMSRLPRICGLRRLGLVLTLLFVIFTAIILRPQYPLFDQDFSISSFSTTPNRGNVIDDDLALPAWPVQVADTGVLARQSLYTRSMFTPDATSHNHFIPVSAIITRLSTDPRAIHHIVRHLLKYPFIKEIIVDDPFDNIDLQLFQDLNFNGSTSKPDDDVAFHIVHNDNRFTTCATNTTHRTCYFQDDSALNLFMDTLYTNHIRHPHLLHANVRASRYLDHQKWRFQNNNGLHAGYADIRYGAMAPRSAAEAFVQHDSESDSADQPEIRFAISMNEYPWVLANSLLTLGREPKPDNGYNNRPRMQEIMYDALRQLEDRHPEATQVEPPVTERDARASCGNDRCIFTTNLSPIPDNPALVGRKFSTNDITSIRQWETLYHDMDIPMQQPWLSHAFHYAVDQDASTCWNSYHYPQIGDYVGLDMVGTMRAKRVILDLGRKIHNSDDLFTVSVAKEPSHWVSCKISKLEEYHTPRRVAIRIHECPGVQDWSSIRITFTRDQREPLELCGMTIDNMVL
ncbi:hypothetical protein RO3G_02319 [Lichtheimia corymbifera JMRC:FSU:9682]|uniref:Uncharacterized protein n=1 Tax=Lichtheimia corymbifera JMRC:FSU:9682 TaxID=1263082 RepID=A0A068RIJ8_9FUNG|nr:hypothetical protein RO3G_02319 [Lichtheimia corymbifera JMRC:FSU:9682]